MTDELDAVLGAYLECAIWIGQDWSKVRSEHNPTGEDDNPTPLDEWATTDDVPAVALSDIEADCDGILELADEHCSDWRDHWTAEQFGHDFHLTRNGHGAGFWDRYWGEGRAAEVGDILTKLAKTYSTCELMSWDGATVEMTF